MKSILLVSVIAAAGLYAVPDSAVRSLPATPAYQGISPDRPIGTGELITGTMRHWNGKKIGSEGQVLVITGAVHSPNTSATSIQFQHSKIGGGSIQLATQASGAMTRLYLPGASKVLCGGGGRGDVFVSGYVLNDEPVFTEEQVTAKLEGLRKELNSDVEQLRAQVAAIPDGAIRLAAYDLLVRDLQEDLSTRLSAALEEVIRTEIEKQLGDNLEDENTDRK